MNISSIKVDVIESFLSAQSVNKRLLIMLAVGALSALAFAPFYIMPMYMISLPVLLIMSVIATSAKSAFKYGYAFGFGHFFVGLYWIGNS
ncbi:MAG: hypothetical protein P8I94_04705, partial [Emcibacteraceae bacterium]|nr:hypothetical protein [Emcibacteraceae bacterium]